MEKNGDGEMCSQQVVYVKKLMEDYLFGKGWTKTGERFRHDNDKEMWTPPYLDPERIFPRSLEEAHIQQLERDNKEKQLGTIHRF